MRGFVRLSVRPSVFLWSCPPVGPSRQMIRLTLYKHESVPRRCPSCPLHVERSTVNVQVKVAKSRNRSSALTRSPRNGPTYFKYRPQYSSFGACMLAIHVKNVFLRFLFLSRFYVFNGFFISSTFVIIKTLSKKSTRNHFEWQCDTVHRLLRCNFCFTLTFLDSVAYTVKDANWQH